MKHPTRTALIGRPARWAAATLVFATLTACGGGASTAVNPVTTQGTVSDYTGPAPANADVQAFKLSLWSNIKAENRCGGCRPSGWWCLPTMA